MAAKGTTPPVDISIATRPSNIGEIPYLLNDIENGIKTLDMDSDEHRKEVLIKCRALLHAIETPRETMVSHCWGQVNV